MDRTALEFDSLMSADSFGEDDMFRLVDDWVQRFERDPDDRNAEPDHAVPPPRRSRVPAPKACRCGTSPVEQMFFGASL